MSLAPSNASIYRRHVYRCVCLRQSFLSFSFVSSFLLSLFLHICFVTFFCLSLWVCLSVNFEFKFFYLSLVAPHICWLLFLCLLDVSLCKHMSERRGSQLARACAKYHISVVLCTKEVHHDCTSYIFELSIFTTCLKLRAVT